MYGEYCTSTKIMFYIGFLWPITSVLDSM